MNKKISKKKHILKKNNSKSTKIISKKLNKKKKSKKNKRKKNLNTKKRYKKNIKGGKKVSKKQRGGMMEEEDEGPVADEDGGAKGMVTVADEDGGAKGMVTVADSGGPEESPGRKRSAEYFNVDKDDDDEEDDNDPDQEAKRHRKIDTINIQDQINKLLLNTNPVMQDAQINLAIRNLIDSWHDYREARSSKKIAGLNEFFKDKLGDIAIFDKLNELYQKDEKHQKNSIFVDNTSLTEKLLTKMIMSKGESVKVLETEKAEAKTKFDEYNDDNNHELQTGIEEYSKLKSAKGKVNSKALKNFYVKFPDMEEWLNKKEAIIKLNNQIGKQKKMHKLEDVIYYDTVNTLKTNGDIEIVDIGRSYTPRGALVYFDIGGYNFTGSVVAGVSDKMIGGDPGDDDLVDRAVMEEHSLNIINNMNKTNHIHQETRITLGNSKTSMLDRSPELAHVKNSQTRKGDSFLYKHDQGNALKVPIHLFYSDEHETFNLDTLYFELCLIEDTKNTGKKLLKYTVYDKSSAILLTESNRTVFKSAEDVREELYKHATTTGKECPICKDHAKWFCKDGAAIASQKFMGDYLIALEWWALSSLISTKEETHSVNFLTKYTLIQYISTDRLAKSMAIYLLSLGSKLKINNECHPIVVDTTFRKFKLNKVFNPKEDEIQPKNKKIVFIRLSKTSVNQQDGAAQPCTDLLKYSFMATGHEIENFAAIKMKTLYKLFHKLILAIIKLSEPGLKLKFNIEKLNKFVLDGYENKFIDAMKNKFTFDHIYQLSDITDEKKAGCYDIAITFLEEKDEGSEMNQEKNAQIPDELFKIRLYLKIIGYNIILTYHFGGKTYGYVTFQKSYNPNKQYPEAGGPGVQQQVLYALTKNFVLVPTLSENNYVFDEPIPEVQDYTQETPGNREVSTQSSNSAQQSELLEERQETPETPGFDHYKYDIDEFFTDYINEFKLFNFVIDRPAEEARRQSVLIHHPTGRMN